jgi:hypothetical protein
MFSAFAIRIANQSMIRLDGSTEDAAVLFPLIGDVITAAKATSSGGLQLNFQSGALLEVHDDSAQYESFTIANGEQLIVV